MSLYYPRIAHRKPRTLSYDALLLAEWVVVTTLITQVCSPEEVLRRARCSWRGCG